MVAMVMVMLTFSMTAFAAETGEVTGDVKVERSKSDVPQPRFPGTASIYSVKAYAYSTALGGYIKNAYTYVTRFTGQFGNMSLNAATAVISTNIIVISCILKSKLTVGELICMKYMQEVH